MPCERRAAWGLVRAVLTKAWHVQDTVGAGGARFGWVSCWPRAEGRIASVHADAAEAVA